MYNTVLFTVATSMYPTSMVSVSVLTILHSRSCNTEEHFEVLCLNSTFPPEKNSQKSPYWCVYIYMYVRTYASRYIVSYIAFVRGGLCLVTCHNIGNGQILNPLKSIDHIKGAMLTLCCRRTTTTEILKA